MQSRHRSRIEAWSRLLCSLLCYNMQIGIFFLYWHSGSRIPGDQSSKLLSCCLLEFKRVDISSSSCFLFLFSLLAFFLISVEYNFHFPRTYADFFLFTLPLSEEGEINSLLASACLRFMDLHLHLLNGPNVCPICLILHSPFEKFPLSRTRKWRRWASFCKLLLNPPKCWILNAAYAHYLSKIGRASCRERV